MNPQVKILYEIYKEGNVLYSNYVSKMWNALGDTNILTENLKKKCDFIMVPVIDKKLHPDNLSINLYSYYKRELLKCNFLMPINVNETLLEIKNVIEEFFDNQEVKRLDDEYEYITDQISEELDKKLNSPLFDAMNKIIEEIEFQTSRQSIPKRHQYFLESCIVHGFTENDANALWEATGKTMNEMTKLEDSIDRLSSLFLNYQIE
jgi:hypothetical protein